MQGIQPGVLQKGSQLMKRSWLALITVLTVGMLLSSRAWGADWPRFRGPNGAGIAADKDVPVQWTDATVLWKTVIPGQGNSSPIVWGNHLFLQSSTASGKGRSLIGFIADARRIYVQR